MMPFRLVETNDEGRDRKSRCAVNFISLMGTAS